MTKPTSKRGPHLMPARAEGAYACPMCGAELLTTINQPKPGLDIVMLTPGALRHLADNHVAGERL